MAFIRYNENPYGRSTIDCTVRALATFLDLDWDDVYVDLSVEGFIQKDMSHMNYIWDSYLTKHGYKRYWISNECPNCKSVTRFTQMYPNGRYLLGIGDHVVPVIDGNYYDIWDSGKEIPLYFYKKGE